MRPDVRGIPMAVVAFLTFVAPGHGTPRGKDPCGDAILVSQSYTAVPARVLAVESGDRLRVRVVAERYVPADWVGTWEVRLVAIEAPAAGTAAAERSRKRLARRVLGRRVHLLESPFQEEGRPRNVMVQQEQPPFADENLGQLAAGMARAVDQGAYDVDWWLRCHYRRAEGEAKAAGRGMWAPPR